MSVPRHVAWACIYGRLGVQVRQSGLSFGGAWAIAEWGARQCDTAMGAPPGSSDQGARWNYAATTRTMPGAWDYNTSAHVKNYPDFATGITAMVETLKLSFYKELVDALGTANVKLQTYGELLAASPWGTGDGIFAAIDTFTANPDLYYALDFGP